MATEQEKRASAASRKQAADKKRVIEGPDDPIRSLRRDPFEPPKDLPPTVKRIKIKKVATDQSGNQHASGAKKAPLVPKRGRQKRKGIAK